MSKEKFSFWLFAFSLALFVWLFYFFLKPFIVASLLVLATFVFAKKLEERLGRIRISKVANNKEFIGACVLTLVFGILIFAPVGYVTIYVAGDMASYGTSDIVELKNKLQVFATQSDFLNDYAKTKLTEYLNTIFTEKFLAAEAKNIFVGLGSFMQGIASSLAELAIIIVFFFLLHWFKYDIISFAKPLIPMDDEGKEMVASEVVGAISVVFLTLVGIMAAQGLAFFTLMLFFDYDAALLGVFCGLSSIVPIFGTALVWVPVALSEFFKGNVFNAVVISAYSWFVMAFLIDNFLRIFFLAKISRLLKSNYKINEFLLFFSIAAGIVAFGFWGVIIGPSITALFLSTARSYKNITNQKP